MLAWLAALASPASDLRALRADIGEAAEVLRATRPTAVNLSWALNRTLRTLEQANDAAEARAIVVRTAREIHAEDIEANQKIGRYGAELIAPGRVR